MTEDPKKPLGLGTIVLILLATGLGLGLVIGLVGAMLGFPTGVTGAAVGAGVGAVGAVLMGRRRAALAQRTQR